jgi:hypothetical protein
MRCPCCRVIYYEVTVTVSAPLKNDGHDGWQAKARNCHQALHGQQLNSSSCSTLQSMRERQISFAIDFHPLHIATLNHEQQGRTVPLLGDFGQHSQVLCGARRDRIRELGRSTISDHDTLNLNEAVSVLVPEQEVQTASSLTARFAPDKHRILEARK